MLRFPWEAAFWVTALAALAIADPNADRHFSLCPLKSLGLNFCPGCNIGHAITFFLHGNVQQSWSTHWLGIPAVVVLSARSLALFYRFWKTHSAGTQIS